MISRRGWSPAGVRGSFLRPAQDDEGVLADREVGFDFRILRTKTDLDLSKALESYNILSYIQGF